MSQSNINFIFLILKNYRKGTEIAEKRKEE